MTGEDAWGRVRGQSAATATLRTALERDDVAHAWLMVGPPGVGQQEAVRALAAALNCPQAPALDRGCGVCSTCERIARGSHPVVMDLEPDGAFHTVEHVRETWIPSVTLSLPEGRRRVMRVIAADRMNEAAQNAFLKVLEEPPASVVWVLDAQDESALLETVVSRCRRLDLVPWGPDELLEQAAAKGIPAAQRATLARASMGLPERLADLADPDVAEARTRHLDILDRLATKGPGVVVPLARELHDWAKTRVEPVKQANAEELRELKEAFGVDEGGRGWPPGMKKRITDRHERRERYERRRALDLVLDDLASYLRDVLAVGSGASDDQLVNLDAGTAARRDAQRLPADAAVRGLAAIEACREALDRNGAPELQLERLLLQLALPLYASRAA
ncbi:MAG: ATP-binding protein [Nitriliruptoraceae bacterium]